MKKQEDEYYLASVKDDGHFRIRVFRPIISDEERARRMERIRHAAIELLLAQERAHAAMAEGGDMNETVSASD